MLFSQKKTEYLFIFRQKSLKLNSYDEIYNENMLKSIKNIQTAAELYGSLAFTALKISAFIPPNILQKLNQIIEQQSSIEQLSILDIISNSSIVNIFHYFNTINKHFF